MKLVDIKEASTLLRVKPSTSKLLGHKDIKMSQRYAHHCQESLRSGVAVLDRISTSSAQSAPEMAKGATDCSVTP
ncbi:MAG: hypothetical protein HZB21_01120 [Deltaproteobacteria bacterium]|nr:hypothetical protein [Deltaproteobacteria bacterium]